MAKHVNHSKKMPTRPHKPMMSKKQMDEMMKNKRRKR